jgi:hypothetical protein
LRPEPGGPVDCEVTMAHSAGKLEFGSPGRRDGTFLAFAETGLAQKYGSEAGYPTQVWRVAEALLADRPLLAEDADVFSARGSRG